MYEPKYQLNRRDDARWRALLLRHCLEASPKPSKKHPPLTAAENAEFEQLTQKRRRKHARHPAIKLARRRQHYRDKKLKKLMAKLRRQVRRLNNNVDEK